MVLVVHYTTVHQEGDVDKLHAGRIYGNGTLLLIDILFPRKQPCRYEHTQQ
jgi:hypothetical protein